MTFDRDSRQDLDVDFAVELTPDGGISADDITNGDAGEIDAGSASSAVRATNPLYSFDELCLPWLEEMHAFACRFVRNKERARDLVQDTMMRAWKAWPRWQPEADPDRSARGWLHQILRNTFITNYHRDKVHRTHIESRPFEILSATHGTYTDAVDPRQGVDPRQEDLGPGDEVTAAVLRLEPRHREMIVRCDLLGQGYTGIAVDMEVPIGTVMSGLHRARRKLAEELKTYARKEYGIERTTPAPAPVVRRRRRVAVAENVTETVPEPAPASNDNP